MRINVSTYIPGMSPVHTCDARVKIVLLAVYSITLFLVKTWMGLALCTVLFAALVALSRIPVGRLTMLLIPIYVLAGFTVLFNGFSLNVFDTAVVAGSLGLGDVSAGVFLGMEPVPLVGSFGFVPTGFARGCFFALRIVLLVVASLLVSFTTTSTALTDAFNDFLRPLRALHLPTDDVAMVFSLALRFIPVTAEEFSRVHDAQWARGAAFDEGGLWQRLRAWQTVLIPLFVGLFRRADSLAIAMDARCYGTPEVRRTSVADRRFTLASTGVLVVGLVVCAAIAYLL